MDGTLHAIVKRVKTDSLQFDHLSTASSRVSVLSRQQSIIPQKTAMIWLHCQKLFPLQSITTFFEKYAICIGKSSDLWWLVGRFFAAWQRDKKVEAHRSSIHMQWHHFLPILKLSYAVSHWSCSIPFDQIRKRCLNRKQGLSQSDQQIWQAKFDSLMLEIWLFLQK